VAAICDRPTIQLLSRLVRFSLRWQRR
jgi:hypothetical protein